MTIIDELNERIIELQDKQIATLEAVRQKEKELHAAEMKRTTELYSGAVRYVAAERDEAIALAEELKKDVQHWQTKFEREVTAFEQAAADRDQALEFIDSIAEMIACDCELSDIADEFIAWRKGEWTPEPDPYRWAVYVVEDKGDERVFTGFFTDYDKARESVDLMIARGCYEAWVEDKA